MTPNHQLSAEPPTVAVVLEQLRCGVDVDEERRDNAVHRSGWGIRLRGTLSHIPSGIFYTESVTKVEMTSVESWG